MGHPWEAHDNRLATLKSKKEGSEHQSGPKERKLRTRKLEASCARSAGSARASLSEACLGLDITTGECQSGAACPRAQLNASCQRVKSLIRIIVTT